MFRSSRLVQTTSSAFKAARRYMGGGGGHDHGHGHAEPAYFLGMKPGAKWEGWEWIAYPTCLICTAIALAPNVDDEYFLDWARKEAIARRQAKEDGEEIKFGTYYSERKPE